jgi:hypothetical protein
MPAVVFLTHIPLLRLAGNEVPFAHGALTHLEWDDYNTLSKGAFEDFQSLYEATGPVFYRVDVHDLAVPPISDAPSTGGMIEFSAPSRAWDALLPQLGLGFMSAYANNVVHPAWIALLLAAPAAAPAWPRLSVSFAVGGDETTSFLFQDRNVDGVRVDGDASHQLLFSPRAAGSEITREAVEHADRLMAVLAAKPVKGDVAAALGALCALTHPALSPDQQTTLAVVTLEALLLPEVTTDLRATFARRLAALLAPGVDREALDRAARTLYDARSASLHGRAGGRGDAARPALAQRALAGAIEALLPESDDVATICARLDQGDGADVPSLLDVEEAAGLQAPDRLQGRMPKIAAALSLGGDIESMAAEEGTLLSWSPLVGLTSETELGFGEDSGVVLTKASPRTVLTLEDKDVRRELGNLLMSDTPIACLGVSHTTSTDDGLDRSAMLRKRDLAVTALRLAGFAGFVDPELLGTYIYAGITRTINSSVFSLMILRGMGSEPEESFVENDIGALYPSWRLLLAYDQCARHDEIDHVVALYRRAHDCKFLPSDARAGLLLATLEAILGRFRAPDDPVQLEDLVHRIAGDDDPAAVWFADNGRALRNAIVHGYWDRDEEPLDRLQALLGPLLVAFLEAWLDRDAQDRRPAQVLLDTLAA